MPNHFCNLLSNGYSFSVDQTTGRLLVAPCCLHTDRIPVEPDLPKKHHSRFGSIRDWTAACRHCHVLESAGQKSLRQTGPDWITDRVPIHAPVMIDINLDKECNAACVICNEHSSSLWARENKKLLQIKERHQPSDIGVQEHVRAIVGSVSLDHVRYVKFFGGEPLFTDTHLHFLREIPCPDQVTLHYTTNASIYPNQQVRDVWSRFKTVIFAASLDGVDDQFDYVRWPLSWSKVSQNLVRMRDSNLHNVMFRVEFTANMLNTFYYDRLEHWVANHLATNQYGDATEINIHHCSNSVFSLANMPSHVRNLVLDKYPKNHVIHQMILNLPFQSNLGGFWDFVHTWDSRRDIAWQHCFPDLATSITNK